MSHFNPRSREGSDTRRILHTISIKYFNPRSREGSDAHTLAGFGGAAISIHAPVKGATLCAVIFLLVDGISIHAPVKGATPRSPSQRCSPRNFNPRSREGSDPSVASTPATKGDFNPRSREGSDQRRSHSSVLRCISIHAPVKGATSSALLRFPGAQYFNPRSREGSDGTAPSCRATGRNFNPRSREGSDALQSLHQGVPWISIHAPVKGATKLSHR